MEQVINNLKERFGEDLEIREGTFQMDGRIIVRHCVVNEDAGTTPVSQRFDVS